MKQCVAGSVETWPSPRPEDEGVSLLASVVNDLARRFGKVGFELGREFALRMPVLDFLRLRDLLTSEAVDGSPCIWEVRNIKSRAEIEKIRQAGQIVSRSFASVPE
ncbi:peptidase M24, partial [Paraburkholderia steynii]